MDKRFLIICVLIAPLFMMNYALAIPGVPHEFCGEVTVNGNSASDGTTVTAEIDGTEVASTTTSNGEYILLVDDPLNDRAGDTVKLFVEGVNTGVTSTFCNACTEVFDLSVTTSSGGGSSGGSSGGGGGGGGGSYVPPSTTGDSTADDGDEEPEETQPPTIPEPETTETTEGAEESLGEEAETTADTGEPTIISRITGAVAGVFSSAENALVGILALIFVVIAGWFASKKFKRKKLVNQRKNK